MFIDKSSYGKLEMILQQSSADGVAKEEKTSHKKSEPSIKSNEESEKAEELTGCAKLKAFLGKRWDMFIFKPKDPFKVKWDIFVILLSIWNSFQIPLGFAFPDAFEDKIGYVVSDQIIDLLFMFDILINFRSCYIDSRTDELVEDTKMIAKNYIKGRFWVDLVASLNFDLIIGPFISDDQSALTDLAGMLKLVRLLRLGRMVTYLSKNKSFKLGAMMV